MAKFWRSGMIDKKVVAKREQAEYINRLQRAILELSRKYEEPEYATFYDDKRMLINVAKLILNLIER